MIHCRPDACTQDTFGNNAKYSVLDFKLTHDVLSSVQAVPKATLDGYILLFKNMVGQVLFQQSLQTGDRIVSVTFSQRTSQLIITTETGEFRCQIDIQEQLKEYALKKQVYTKEQVYTKDQTYSKEQVNTQLPYLQTGLDNTIVGDYHAAIGNGVIVGQKTFLMDAVAALDDGQSLSCRVNKAADLQIGDVVSLVDRRHYYNCARIVLIQAADWDYSQVRLQVEPQFNATQMVGYLPTDIIEDPDQKGYLFVLAKPECGQRILSQGNVAEGSHTQATYTSHAQGFNTKAYGRYSHTEGYGTLAGYVSHAQGINTQASGEYAHAQGDSTKALGQKSHAEGYGTQAKAPYAHAEGNSNQAAGEAAHAEGYKTTASGEAAHSEGYKTNASGKAAHAEGYNTKATELGAHAEGSFTDATGPNSHAEGRETVASGDRAHAEGHATVASGEMSHAEGSSTESSGVSSHAEGSQTTASGPFSHAEGYGTIASEFDSHAEGYTTTASGRHSHAEGKYTTASGHVAHAEGNTTTASGEQSHAEGLSTKATGQSSHSEGLYAAASGQAAHAEGTSTEASGVSSHAEGSDTTASGVNSHSEGSYSYSYGPVSHAEGRGTKAGIKDNVTAGEGAHAEGRYTTASGQAAHAEGNSTVASGAHSHTEGTNSKATASRSHAEGFGTIASIDSQHVQGKYNVAVSGAHVVGNGTSDANRKNIHVLDWNGDAYFAGDVYVRATNNGANKACTHFANKLATQQYVNSMFGKPVQVDSIVKLTNDDRPTLPDGTAADESIVLPWPDQLITLSGYEKGGVIALNPGCKQRSSSFGETTAETLVKTIIFGKQAVDGTLGTIYAEYTIANDQFGWKFLPVPANTDLIVLKIGDNWYDRYPPYVAQAAEIMAVIT